MWSRVHFMRLKLWYAHTYHSYRPNYIPNDTFPHLQGIYLPNRVTGQEEVQISAALIRIKTVLRSHHSSRMKQLQLLESCPHASVLLWKKRSFKSISHYSSRSKKLQLCESSKIFHCWKVTRELEVFLSSQSLRRIEVFPWFADLNVFLPRKLLI